ncbi:MAG TPA: 4Fe-4S binding protein, partial [Deltaproteobacteria bacterium]|nr:4Fe-4S binding protein [Deltaproteobacteria bacterium]
PGTGVTISGEKTTDIDLESLVKALGIPWVRTVNPYAVNETRQAVKEALDSKGPAVIISRAPCVLLKTRAVPGTVLEVDPETCTGCKVCISLGCPALEFDGEKAHINGVCVGCNVCAEICPAGAIGGGS